MNEARYGARHALASRRRSGRECGPRTSERAGARRRTGDRDRPDSFRVQLKLDSPTNEGAPPARETMVTADGIQKPARLIEFE